MRTLDATRPRVRAIRSTDSADLKRFYRGLSDEGRRERFLYPNAGPTQSQCTTFCTTDHDHREGFVAVVDGDRDGHERIVGHLCLESDRSGAAEVAIAVAEDFQHQGIGRRLLIEGVAWARREGIAQLTATMFAGNPAIQRLLLGAGLPARERYIGAGVTEITMDLASSVIVRGAAA